MSKIDHPLLLRRKGASIFKKFFALSRSFRDVVTNLVPLADEEDPAAEEEAEADDGAHGGVHALAVAARGEHGDALPRLRARHQPPAALGNLHQRVDKVGIRSSGSIFTLLKEMDQTSIIGDLLMKALK